MKRSTIINQKISDYNSYDILIRCHRMWIRNPRKLEKIMLRLGSEEINSRRKWISQQYWWMYSGELFEEFFNYLYSKTYLPNLTFRKFISDKIININDKYGQKEIK